MGTSFQTPQPLEKSMKQEIDRVLAALKNKRYREAANLLKPLLQQEPENPRLLACLAQVYEAGGKADKAERLYRQVMRDTTNPQTIAQARQGLQRLLEREKALREAEIERAKNDPANAAQGLLILEAIALDKRQEAAQLLVRTFGMDGYTAKLQFPNKGWRLFKTGPIGTMCVYAQQLREAGVPAFAVPLPAIKELNVLRVMHFERLEPQPAIAYRDVAGERGTIAFDWSEVRRQVQGFLPIFVETASLEVSSDRSKRFQKRTETNDYARVWDFHLLERNTIVRLCDQSYQFHEGIDLTPPSASEGARKMTARLRWNYLSEKLAPHLSAAPVWSEFTQFAENAVVSYREMLDRISASIDIPRPKPSPWDPSFQLYSGLVFAKGNSVSFEKT